MKDHNEPRDDHGRFANEPLDATRKRANQAIEANPLAIVAGGLALGAIAGALIPRSQKEKALLAPLGHQLNQRARNAFAAAKAAGTDQLHEQGISRSAARDQVRSFVDGIGQALSSAGQAAAKSAAASPD